MSSAARSTTSRSETSAHSSPSFSCRLDDLKSLLDLLSCLYVDVAKDSECDIEVTPESFFLRVTTKGRSCQGRASVALGLFEDFQCAAEGVSFTVNLSIFIDCLKLFGTSLETTVASMSYSSDDAVFRLSLEETGVVTVCEIATLFHDTNDEFVDNFLSAFRRSDERCQLIVRSEPLKEAIQELADSLWLDAIEVTVRASELKFSTGGTVGTSEIILPMQAPATGSTAESLFVSFKCPSGYVREVFPLRAFLLSMKALTIAKESFLRINEAGMLCVQHQVESKRGAVHSYVDYFVIAEDRDGHNNDAEEEDTGGSGTRQR